MEGMAEPIPDRKRSLLGRLCLALFWLFNASMLGWLVLLWSSFRSDLEPTSEIEYGSAVIDATATTGLVVALWLLGAAITGLLAVLTRPR